MNILNKILPNIIYKNGFLINGQLYPYYSYCKPDEEISWSDELDNLYSFKEHFMNIYTRKIALEGIKTKLFKKETTYVDIGCFSGYMLEEINKRYPDADILGVDYSGPGLYNCHNRLPHIPLLQLDLVNCPFDDNLFDAITCLGVLEHIQQDVHAIRQLFRILKPGGMLVISVPVQPHLYDMYDEVLYHIRRYKLSELIKKIQCTGLKVLKANYYGTFIYPMFFLTKKLNKLFYDKLPFEKKIKKASAEAKSTKGPAIIKYTCLLEELIGRRLTYPFGIRGYVYATK